MNQADNMISHIIETWQDFCEMSNYIESIDSEYLVLDVETDSVNEKTAKLYGIGICLQDHEAFYIPWRTQTGEEWWGTPHRQHIRSWLYKLASNKKLIGWNIIYDLLVLESNFGKLYDLTEFVYADGMLMKHTVNEERPHGLKETAARYLGEWATKAQDEMYASITANGGKTTKDNLEMFKCDTNILGTYCCWDVLLTLKLFNLFSIKLNEEGLEDLFYKDEVMPLYKYVTIPAKRNGFPVDVDYFKQLNFEITEDITKLKREVQQEIAPIISEYIDERLNKDYPCKRTGLFPKYAAKLVGLELPTTKEGNITLAKKGILNLPFPNDEKAKHVLSWLREESDLSRYVIRQTQEILFKINNEEEDYFFNLKSNDDLKYLFFEQLQEEPLGKTDGGDSKVDDDFLDSIKDKYNWVSKLIDYKKLIKLKGTYIEGILERQIDGIIYTSLLQHGTTSGRYSSTNPNLQNLPRVKDDDAGLSELVLKYVNSIRRGFIAPKGYVLVDADQSALEPKCFASVSGDYNLQKIFLNGEDLYSSIAIRSFGVEGLSPFKKDANFVGKIKPELRQKVKAYALAVAYGAQGTRISQLLNIEIKEADKLITDYLTAYPGLKNYIDQCHKTAKETGMVKTKFGRIRHLPRVQYLYRQHKDNLLDWKYVKKFGLQQEKYEFKNGLNNSTNFPIQSLAAHIMNRSAVDIMKRFKENNIDGYLALQVHDQVIAIVKEEQATEALNIVRDSMENCIKIDVPLQAEPKIANNLADSH